jgi:hypothetical protein
MSNFKKDFGENVDDPFSTTTKRTLRWNSKKESRGSYREQAWKKTWTILL